MASGTNKRSSVEQARKSFDAALRSPEFERIHGDDEQLQIMLTYLDPTPDGTYLDLATGTGYVAFALVDRVCDVKIIGVDIADQAIATNNRLAAERGLSNVEFHVVDGTHLPFADQTFDGIICRYAMHHFPEPGATLADVHRILKPGGRLVVADAVRNEVDRTDFINAFQALKPDGHVEMYAPDKLAKLLTYAGFSEEDRHMAAITFTRQLDAAHMELLANTPPEISKLYLLDVGRDQAQVRFDVLNLLLSKSA